MRGRINVRGYKLVCVSNKGKDIKYGNFDRKIKARGFNSSNKYI